MVYRCLYHRGDFGDGLPEFYQCFSHVIGVYRSFPMETAGFPYINCLYHNTPKDGNVPLE
jgi:hypothetical protein